MRRALGEYEIQGIQTNIPFFRRVLEHPDFVAGRLDTGFIDRVLAAGLMEEEPPSEEEERVALLAALLDAERNGAHASAGWTPPRQQRMEAGRPRRAALATAHTATGGREVLMKFNARLHRGSKILEHEVELVAQRNRERRAALPRRRPDRGGALRGNHSGCVLVADEWAGRTKPSFQAPGRCARARRPLCGRRGVAAISGGVARSAAVAPDGIVH